MFVLFLFLSHNNTWDILFHITTYKKIETALESFIFLQGGINFFLARVRIRAYYCISLNNLNFLSPYCKAYLYETSFYFRAYLYRSLNWIPGVWITVLAPHTSHSAIFSTPQPKTIARTLLFSHKAISFLISWPPVPGFLGFNNDGMKAPQILELLLWVIFLPNPCFSYSECLITS